MSVNGDKWAGVDLSLYNSVRTVALFVFAPVDKFCFAC